MRNMDYEVRTKKESRSYSAFNKIFMAMLQSHVKVRGFLPLILAFGLRRCFDREGDKSLWTVIQWSGATVEN